MVCPFDGCRLCHLSGIVGQSSSACAKNAGAEAFAGRFPVRAPLPVRVSIRQRLGPMSRWRSPTGAPLNTCDDRPRPRSGASSSAGDAARSRDWPLRPLPTASRHAPRGVAKLGLCPVVDRGHLLDQLLHTDLRQPTLQDLRDDRRVRRRWREMRMANTDLARTRPLRPHANRRLDLIVPREFRCDHDEVLIAHANDRDAVAEARAEEPDNRLGVPRRAAASCRHAASTPSTAVRIPVKSITRSDRTRSAIPKQSDHLSERSDAGLSTARGARFGSTVGVVFASTLLSVPHPAVPDPRIHETGLRCRGDAGTEVGCSVVPRARFSVGPGVPRAPHIARPDRPVNASFRFRPDGLHASALRSGGDAWKSCILGAPGWMSTPGG